MTDAVTLYDAADAASAGRRTGRFSKQPPVLWLTSETVTVGAGTWTAHHHAGADDGPVHGYTPRQCRQICAALLPVLAGYETGIVPFTNTVC